MTARFSSAAIAALALVVAATGGACSATSAAPSSASSVDAGACPEPAALAADGPIELYRTVPGLSFAGLDPSGAPKTITLAELRLPCATEPELLVVRVGATWCGSCLASAVRSPLAAAAGHVELMDLVVGNEDNMPPSVADLTAYRARLAAPRFVGADPEHRLRTVNPQRGALPLVVIVNRKSMRIESFDNDPSPDALALRIRRIQASLAGAEKPIAPAETLHDGRFTEPRWGMIAAMKPPGPPPPDPTNAVADDPRAASFGGELFADTTLSPTGRISCATCHDKAKGFSDGLPQSEGVSGVDRNAPSIAFAAHTRWQFWDGRADTLWMQALGPFENAKEIGSSRLFALHRVYDLPARRAAYEAIFGPMPALADTARFPAAGMPGVAAYDAMTAADREAATRAFVNLGKAVAAFERAIAVQPNALDRYAAGESAALTDPQKDGLLAFFDGGCAQCHYGPRLTDDAFHAVAFGTGRKDRAPDRGRIDGAAPLLASALSGMGRFSDAPLTHASIDAVATTPRMLGAFKTPTLRGLPASAPYGHGGTFATLEELMKHYAQAGSEAPPGSFVGESEPWLVKLDDKKRDAIPALLRVLEAAPVP